MPSAYAYFKVSADDLPHDEISRVLEIDPTERWKRGDPGKYNPSLPSSGWCLHSPLPRSQTDLRAHIEAVLDLLRPRAEGVRAIGKRFETFLVCVGNYDGTASPGLFLSREAVALIASLGLAIDADLYFDAA